MRFSNRIKRRLNEDVAFDLDSVKYDFKNFLREVGLLIDESQVDADRDPREVFDFDYLIALYEKYINKYGK